MTSPSERIVGLYEKHAHAWDDIRGYDLHEQPWLERFASLVPQGGCILDIGCGGGEPVARWFIERGFALTGLDSSPSLIAMCRERFPEQQWIVGDMRELALGQRFDGIIAWHSFFHLSPDDQRPMFPRFAAHARPGAALIFTSGPEHGEAIGEWQGEPLYHASLGSDEYEMLLAENGLQVIDCRLRDLQCGGATVWLTQRL